MASILDLSAGSSDSEDDGDYVPPDVAASESSGEEEIHDNSDSEAEQKPKRAKRTAKGNKLEAKKDEPIIPVVDEKKREDDIWKSFLSDVGTEIKKKPTDATAHSETKASAGHDNSKSDSISSVAVSKSQEKPAKVSIADTFEFAGETFTVEKNATSLEMNSCSHGAALHAHTSKENSLSSTVQAAPLKRGGLDSIIGAISNKKKKLTVLEKTLYDWKDFKKKEGIEEDLETYNKGRGGFLERQNFLQRSDVRSFEVEKSLRLAKKFK